jgi:hypothetical protein
VNAYGIPVSESSWLPPGTALIFQPGAFEFGPKGIVVNPSDMVVLRLGYRPFFSRYTAGERERGRDRRRAARNA